MPTPSLRRSSAWTPLNRRRNLAAKAGQAPPSRIDIWLARSSHFAQFALFAITLGSLYFTVLPLYQKALLEELVAQRESQLKELTVATRKARKNFHRITIENWSQFAAETCDLSRRGGMYEFITKKPRPKGRDFASTLLQGSRGEARDLRADNDAAQREVLNTDISDCLVESITYYRYTSELSQSERETLVRAVRSVAASIESDRKRISNEAATLSGTMTPLRAREWLRTSDIGPATEAYLVRSVGRKLNDSEAIAITLRLYGHELVREHISNLRTLLEQLSAIDLDSQQARNEP